MNDAHTVLRADRLVVLLRVLDVADDFRAGRFPEAEALLTRWQIVQYHLREPEDVRLAESCLVAERDLRRREWEGLEQLLAAIPPGGNLEDVYRLPVDQALSALGGAHACGWLREAEA